MINKFKLLCLSDHPLAPSGVGTQSNLLFVNLLRLAEQGGNEYTIRSFGGAIKHGNYDPVMVAPFGERYIISPTDNFGTPMKLRTALATEQPDALFLFTDPRFFIWVWEMEDEIHDVCPIVYNHVWDEDPYPDFNSVLYEATDLINCISWKTYNMIQPHFPEKTNYVPHALIKDIYHPLSRLEIIDYKKHVLGQQYTDYFVAFWSNRNARRKRPNDVLVSWKLFLDKLEQVHHHRNAIIIMHTDPLDSEGPNLYKTIEMLNITDNVFISKDKLEFDKLNVLYNVSDVIVNISHAEGFGLSTLESLYCGTPIIAVKTGGQTEQVCNIETGEQYGIALEADVKTMVGSQSVPFIWEVYVSNEKIANAFFDIYEWGPEKRERVGKAGMEYVHKEFNLERLVSSWDKTLEKTILDFRANKNKPRYKTIEL